MNLLFRRRKSATVSHAFEPDETFGWVVGIRNGDQQAFEAFFRHYYTFVFRFLSRFTLQHEVAEDLAQEVFVKLWESRERLDPEQSVRSYLFQIASNLAINYRQRVAKRVVSLGDEDLIFSAPGPHEILVGKSLDEALEQALKNLPDQCRVIFLLSRFEDFSNQEIAATLDLSVQTVKNQVSKALHLLRRQLKGYL